MKKSLLFSAVLATVLFAGNAMGKTVSTGPFKVDNKTGADVWLHARIVGILGKSDYLHVSPGEKYFLKDLAVSKIKFRSYVCNGGVPVQIENDYTIKDGDTYWLTLTIEGGKLVVKERPKSGTFDF